MMEQVTVKDGDGREAVRELRSGVVVEWRSGKVVESQSGVVVEWRSSNMVER